MLTRLLLSILTCLLLSYSAMAVDFYWVGGSGKWSEYNLHWATSSGGSSFHVQVPTNQDNVFFDNNSGFAPGNNTLTIDQTIVYCQTMDWTGVTDNPKVVSFLSSNVIKIFGSLKLNAAMNWAYTGYVSFEATTPGHTIASAGKTFTGGSVTFNGTGGSWTLVDSLTVTDYIYHNAGTLTTNNQNVSSAGYSHQATNTRALYLGSSLFKINPKPLSIPNSVANNWYITPTNFTFNAGTSTILFVGTVKGGFSSSTLTYYKIESRNTGGLIMYLTGGLYHEVDLKTNTSINGNTTTSPIFEQLTFAGGKTYELDGIIKISSTGALTANGTCALPINIKSSSNGITAFINKSSGVVSVNYVYLQDLQATGVATFNAVNSLAISNVTNWNIVNPTAKNLYWIGGKGNWSDVAHWSTSSGGSANATCIPSLVDNVFFDANSGFSSGNNTVTMDLQQTLCNNMTWTNVSNTPLLKGGTEATSWIIRGSLAFSQGMLFDFTGNVFFSGPANAKTIQSANKVFKGDLVNFSGVGSTYTLLDSLSGTSNTVLSLQSGTFNTGGYNINAGGFKNNVDAYLSSTRKLMLNQSRVIITGYNPGWTMIDYNFTLDAGTSTIIFNTAVAITIGTYPYYNMIASNYLAFFGPAKFHKLILSGNATIDQNNTYDSLVLTPGKTYTFSEGSIQTILNGTLVANGTCSNPILLKGSGPCQFKKTSGTISANYLIIKDVSASGGAAFIGNNSYANETVTGWTINLLTARSLYWVGGGGDWFNASHWSTSSGGPGGACIPLPVDDVFFNSQSGFTTSSKTVTAASRPIYCHDMDWTGSTNNPIFSTSVDVEFTGSVTFIAAMTNNPQPGNYTFSSKTTEDITTGNQKFPRIYFTGPGTWNLSGTLNCFGISAGIILYNGTLKSNNYPINVEFISSAGSSNRKIQLGSSQVTIKGSRISLIGTNLTFDAGTSVITFPSSTPTYTYYEMTGNSDGLAFYNVIFPDPTKLATISGNNSFNRLRLSGPGTLSGNNQFDTLSLAPGRSYKFYSNTTQTIKPNGLLDAMGTPGFPVELLSNTPGSTVFISKASGVVCLDYLFLKDIHAKGGATFYAGANGANVSNNSGWLFSACSITGIENGNKEQLEVFPVPAHDRFELSHAPSDKFSLEIIDGLGHSIRHLELEGSIHTIDVAGLPAGLYSLILTTNNSKVYEVRKIMLY